MIAVALLLSFTVCLAGAKKPTATAGNENILANVYSAYFGIKDALIKSDGKSASDKANELLKAVSEVSMDKMSTEEHAVWMKYAESIKKNAGKIAAASEVKEQRKHLSELSTNLYEIAKSFKLDGSVYYQNCPMFNGAKGAKWLSLESKIKNPYYGSQMLGCGSTVETIK